MGFHGLGGHAKRTRAPPAEAGQFRVRHNGQRRGDCQRAKSIGVYLDYGTR